MTEPPALRVVRGEPAPEELAALVVALTAYASSSTARPARYGWNDRWFGVRRPLPVGPGAWTASGRPH